MAWTESCPSKTFIAVVTGTYTDSSGLVNPELPFAFVTPIIRNDFDFIVIVSPIGFASSPNRSVATSGPSTATLLKPDSSSVLINSP